MTNVCVYDCQYCVNRRSNDLPRAAFTPRELCELTMGFYRRNYIEGLFLSSAVLRDPDYTTERMIQSLRLLREEYRFGGYIHAKAIPGADPLLTRQAGAAGRPAEREHRAAQRPEPGAAGPGQEKGGHSGPHEADSGRHHRLQAGAEALPPRPPVCPRGTVHPDDRGGHPGERPADSHPHPGPLSEVPLKAGLLLRLHARVHQPPPPRPPGTFSRPLLREHRLYQADWLLRFYHFRAEEILDENQPNLDPRLDPKCGWALRHLEHFPVEVNRADYETLLRVPGIGVKSARRILAARRLGPLNFQGLKQLGVVLKRAQYFITCSGRMERGLRVNPDGLLRHLVALEAPNLAPPEPEQLSLFSMGGVS